MFLNIIWLLFFGGAFVACLAQWLYLGNSGIFNDVMQSVFAMSKTSFEIAIGLTGILAFWLGMMKIGEKAGAVQMLAKLVAPLMKRLFPSVPVEHPAMGSMLMNMSANMLGLDNAATPLGLKAMKELQELNPQKDTASDAQILFLVLNASGLTLIPVTIMTYRAKLGAANPADIFLPILFATFFSTVAGILVTAFFQKIEIKNIVFISWFVGLSSAVFGSLFYFSMLSAEEMGVASAFLGGIILFSIVMFFLILAAVKKVMPFDAFVEGAKEGFSTAVMIIPYLIAILVGVAAFRASGAMDFIMGGIVAAFNVFGIPSDVVPSLPTAFMKPLSGSGARGMMVDAMQTYGADSFVGRLSCIFQGTTDTTFYILAVYFGSVAIRKTRHAVFCGLTTDVVSAISAITIAYIFFPP
ncbi:MAG: spore maturation protein [Fibromonadales bacterium]|nr:spore maturation protein [Fibromonadales bacterium]